MKPHEADEARLRRLNPGRYDLEFCVVDDDVHIVKYRGSPPVMWDHSAAETTELEALRAEVARLRARLKPTVPEVGPIVRALYARHGAGCCWHLVLDDGNYDSVAWCVDRIAENGCYEAPATECLELAKLLPLMTKTQLRKLARNYT